LNHGYHSVKQVSLDELPSGHEDDHHHKKQQRRIRMKAQLHNHNPLQPGLHKEQELLRIHSPSQELLHNHSPLQELLRIHNQQRHRRMNGYHSEPSACSANRLAFRKSQHRLAQQRHNHNLRSLELHKVLELVQVLVRSKELLPFRIRNQKHRHKSGCHNEHEACPTIHRHQGKNRRRLAQRHSHNLRSLELHKVLELEQVLVRNKELLPFRIRNQTHRHKSGCHNEHEACPTIHHRHQGKNRHRLAQLHNHNLRSWELHKVLELVQVLARSKELLPFRIRNQQHRHKSGCHNEHEAWPTIHRRHQGKIRHRLVRLRNHNLPSQQELAHSKVLLLALSKTVRNRKEFRDAHDYPHGSTGRNANRIRNHHRWLRRIRNLP